MSISIQNKPSIRIWNLSRVILNPKITQVYVEVVKRSSLFDLNHINVKQCLKVVILRCCLIFQTFDTFSLELHISREQYYLCSCSSGYESKFSVLKSILPWNWKHSKKQRNHIDIDNVFEKLSVGRQMCVALIILPKRIYTNE